MKGLVIFAILLLGAATADAYCVVAPGEGAFNRFTSGRSLNDTPIPIYLVTSGVNSVLDDPAKVNSHGVGLTQSEMENALRAIARSWSESSARVKMYYAGTRASSDPSVEAWLILSFDDASRGITTSAVTVSSGINGALTSIKPGSPTNVYTTSPFDSANSSNIKYFKQLLMHESYHALGGGPTPHPDDFEPCPSDFVKNEPGWCSVGSFCDGHNTSVLSIVRESPTSDDILGARARYGVRTRTMKLYQSSSGVAGTWTLTNSFLDYSNVPPAISAPTSGHLQTGSAIAYTDTADVLRVLYDNGSGSYGSSLLVGGLAYKTVQKPLVAVGNGKVMVQWIDMADLTGHSAIIDTCILTLNTGIWSCFQGDSTILSMNSINSTWFGNDFDGGSGRFVNTGYDDFNSEPRVTTVNETNGRWSQQASLGTIGIRGLSKPSCTAILIVGGASDCFMTTAWGSTYRARFIRFHVNASAVPVYDSTTAKFINGAFGLNDLAQGNSGDFIVSRSNNDSTATVFKTNLMSTNVSDLDTFTTNYWPIAVGGLTTWTSFPISATTTYRLVIAP